MQTTLQLTASTVALHGQSPAMPLDLILQSLAQAEFSGFLRAVQPDGSRFRLIFVRGRLAFSQGCASTHDVTVVRQLLSRPSVWGAEVSDMSSILRLRATVEITAVLMEVARLNDEAMREVDFAPTCGC